MDSIYYCFLCDAENISGKTDAVITREEMIQAKNKWIREVQKEIEKAKSFEKQKNVCIYFEMTITCGVVVEG